MAKRLAFFEDFFFVNFDDALVEAVLPLYILLMKRKEISH